MESSRNPERHIANIFKDFQAPSSRVLESFTNLSNTVIDTALSGQNKFIFEILQNADDSCNDQSRDITVKFILEDGFFIVQHDGKEFDYNDVDRLCDYASQIKEVKARDLSKTGYKGIGFKSLFNLSKCIYIYSGGYSFRFDKSYWPNPASTPWQVIPIWRTSLPLREKYKYDKPVNFILKVKRGKHLVNYLNEVLDQPESFLFLHHVNNFCINLFGEEHFLQRKVESFGKFAKYNFFKNQSIVSTWLSRTYEAAVPTDVQNAIQKGSQYTYPDKIKNARKVPISFTLQTDETGQKIIKINGLCFNTLPTQLYLTLPYHINSFFILNLDRTQLDENKFNEFLMEELGYFQLNLLKDLAEVQHLRNFVIELLTLTIKHPYTNFKKAFTRGLSRAKKNIAWLPAQDGSHLMKLNEAWIDEILFFKQNFKDITDEISGYVINYDVTKQHSLPSETKRFTYSQLFNDFTKKYYPYFNDDSYVNFISYLYKSLKTYRVSSSEICKLQEVSFLRAKNGKLLSPKNSLLEDINNPIPDFFELNPIDNKFLPLSNSDSIRDWLVSLGVKKLTAPVFILRESLFKWIDSNSLHLRISMKNHIGIINFLAAVNAEILTNEEIKKLKDHMLVLTESKKFKLLNKCYLPETFPIKELEDILSPDEKILPVYEMESLKQLLMRLGIQNKLSPITLLRKSILTWIKTNQIRSKLTTVNYNSIVDYFAPRYLKIQEKLTDSELSEMKKMPVLTCAKTFQRAEVCFFDSALLNVPGFDCAIPRQNLVCSKNISSIVYEFLAKLGVSKEMQPIDIIRKSVLKWIQEGTVKSKINSKNHQHILNYIAEKWELLRLSGLEHYEREYFGRFPILTKNETFKEASLCYWQTEEEKIPHIESIISSNDFVSSSVYSSLKIKELLSNEYFGVRSLAFKDVWERYCNHLTNGESIKWFFFHLIHYWENKSQEFAYRLLTCIKVKLETSYLLSKNGRTYRPKELYSFRFSSIHDIDPGSLPLLHYTNLANDLEEFLGFKCELEMPCIVKLLEAFGKKQENGTMNENKTVAFFTILLEQLKCKNHNEIKRYTIKLLSKANELKSAKELYYFAEENSICTLSECYLKRISGMSHTNTLELAKLCGVNIVPFNINASFEDIKYVSTLKEFYLYRLPFIVLKEARERNDNPLMTLKNLYGHICSIELAECQKICIKYPFGKSTNERHHFNDLKLYVTDNWRDHSSHIHKYIKEKFFLKADIDDIIDMQTITQNKKEEWLQYEKEDPKIFYQIENEIQKILSVENERNSNAQHSVSHDNEDVEASLPQHFDVDCRQEYTTHSNTLKQHLEQENESVSDEQSTCSEASDDSDPILLQQILVDSRQATRDNTLTQCFEQDKRSFDEQSSSSEDSEQNDADSRKAYSSSSEDSEGERPPLKNDVGSRQIYTTHDNTLTQCLEKENKRAFDEPSSSSEASEDVEDFLPQECDSEFVQETQNILNEFYLGRLPSIVIRESRKLNQSPHVVLKRLYDKVSCIELFQKSYINKSLRNISAKPKCSFDGLRVHVLGKWTDHKNEIHEHIIQELCLDSNVEDIIDMESLAEKNKEEWIRSRKEKARMFHLIEKELQELLQDQTKLNDKETSSYEFRDKELEGYTVEDKETSVQTSKEKSTGNIDGRNSSMSNSTKNEESYTNPEDPIEIIERTTNHKNILSWDELYSSGLSPNVSQSQLKKRVTEEDEFIEKLPAEFCRVTPGPKSDKSHMQRLHENYVFTYLQDYYKRKYPNAKCSLTDGCFTLKWESHSLDLIWLNETGDKELLFDLMLKKDGEIKQLIEVQSFAEIDDSFNVSKFVFLRSDQLYTMDQTHKEKLRIYCVFNTEDSIPTDGQMDRLFAFYKIVPLTFRKF